MVRFLLVGTALVALGTGADAQRGRRAPADPYAAANNHSTELNPIGAHSRSRPLEDLQAIGALTSAEVQARRAREAAAFEKTGAAPR